MKRTFCVLLVALLALVLVTSAYAAPNWRITLQVTKPAVAGFTSGAFKFGANSTACDGKDGADTTMVMPMGDYVVFQQTRPDQATGYNLFSTDFRSLWTQGTKSYTNIALIAKNWPAGTAMTLNWTPDTSASLGLPVDPTAVYTLTNLDTGASFDISKAGSTNLDVPSTTGTIANFRITVSFGTALVPTAITRVGTSLQKIVGSPAVDESGNIYVALSDGGVYKVAGGTVSKMVDGAGTAAANLVMGRIAYYGGNLYFGNSASGVAQLNAITTAGAPVFAPVALPGATCSSTPAVDTVAGNIYVGTDTSLARVTAAGAVGASKTVLAAAGQVFSPAMAPDATSARIWVSASDGTLVAFDKDLANPAVASKTIGTPVAGAPAVMFGKVIAAGGTKLYAFDAISGTDAGAAYDALANITSAPYFTADGTAIFMSADNKLHAVNVNTMASISAAFPVALPATPTKITGSLPDSSPAVKGGKVIVGGGAAGTGHYIVDLASGTVKVGAGTDSATASPVFTADGSKAIFVSKDGCIYVYTP